jgi:uncharacterized protein YkwD
LPKLVRRIAALIILPVAFAGVALLFSAAPSSAASMTPAEMESWVIALTNKQRAAHGCAPVYRNNALVTASKRHAGDMARRGYFSHTSPGGSNFVARARYAGYQYASGENIAWGQRTATAVVNAWMASPGHRANILKCSHKKIGVGVAFKSNGTPYWVQMFGRI